MWIGARTEMTLRAVHEKNLKLAEAAGLTLDKWHKMMSEKGNRFEPKPTLITKKGYVPRSPTEYVLNQLFPNVHNGNESNTQTDIS